MYTAISGVESGKQILPGRPHGGVGILYKKSLTNKITAIKSNNRRVCGVKIEFNCNTRVYYYQFTFRVIIIVTM